MSRGACEEEDCMSFLNTYESLRYVLLKEQLINWYGKELSEVWDLKADQFW